MKEQDNSKTKYVGKCEHCGKENTIPYKERLVPKFCKNCGEKVDYSLSK